jgi:hypothetical protein
MTDTGRALLNLRRAGLTSLPGRGVWPSWIATRAAFAVGLVLAHLGSRKPLLPGDIAVVYFNAARRLVHGDVPYLSFHYEYPPGTLPVLGMTWLLGGHSRTSFVAVWCLLMLVLDAVIVQRLTRYRFGVAAAYAWIIGLCLIGPTALLRNDLIVSASFVVAFLMSAEKGTVAGGALWMLGVLAKVWPLAPMAAVLFLRRPGRIKLATGAAAVLGATTLALAADGALGAMVRYLPSRQGQRPIEIESLWATPVWLHALATGRPVHLVNTFGSENLVGGRTLMSVATLSTAAIQLACALTPWLILRRRHAPIAAEVLAWTFALYVSATLLIAPVLSPQYAVWLLAVSCVLLGVVGPTAAGGFVVATLLDCGLTQLVFPGLFTQLQHGYPAAITALVLRNSVLTGVFVLGVCGLRRSVTDQVQPTVPSRLGLRGGSPSTAQLASVSTPTTPSKR